MLCQDIEAPPAKVLAIPLSLVDRVTRGHCFEKFKAVSRYEQGPAWLVQAVIGSPDALQQPR
jgi:hypothetical protein